MKKLLFATALLAALLLSACGGKTNDDDFMNKPAVTPEPGMEIDPEFGVDPEPETDENAQPAPDAELSDMVDAIYKIQPVELMGMETTAIDLTDETWYGYLAGLTADKQELLALNWPDILFRAQAICTDPAAEADLLASAGVTTDFTALQLDAVPDRLAAADAVLGCTD